MAGRSEPAREDAGADTPSVGMTRLQVVAFLNDLERRHDVNAMIHKGVRIWPLLRMKIGEHLIAHELADAAVLDQARRNPESKWKQLAIGTVSLLPFHRHIERTDLLFYTENRFTEIWDGVAHERYADPLIGAAGELGLRSTVVEHRHGVHPPANRSIHCPRYDMSPPLALRAALHARKPKPDPRSVVGLEALLREVLIMGNTPTLPHLASQLHDFDLYLDLHTRLLRESRPQCVFLVCWYATENLAVQHVCHALGIRCVDLQHGIQGKGHLAYGPWAALPSDAYSVMPSAFWCWDEDSANNIMAWAAATPLKALALGNPWMEGSTGFASQPVWEEDGRTRVLYTAFLPDVLPYPVLDAIRETRTTCQWIVRTHPGNPQLPTLIAEVLGAEGLTGNARVSRASDLPLAAVLKGCDLHITQYSSVVLEAVSMGVPSVAIHRNAADLFAEALASGALHIALTLDELRDHLRAPRQFHGTTTTPAPLVERLRRILQ